MANDSSKLNQTPPHFLRLLSANASSDNMLPGRALLLSTTFITLALATPLTPPASADGRQCGGTFPQCPRGYTCQMPLTPCASPIHCLGKCRPVWDQHEPSGRPCGDEGDRPCPKGYTCIVPLILCPPAEQERCRGWCDRITPS
ncbi:hypothetical protein B0T14DRAFT_150609 [Immersiella caudata]|uniref:Uncharacterized protein n=1 Tax=Immersiella caudata TaxID=314043 RepID=A0AA39WVZ2_9PEZI|nr:hypothetical protein B0T14DRAFT_150609 [Immersiella caudata]